MKICLKCLIEKPLSDFYKNKSQTDGLQDYCKPCNLAQNKKYELKYPARKIYRTSREHAKERNHLSICDYMTLEDFEIWYNTQIKECAICKTTENLCVDHDHTTGKPIGILCDNHNRVEGLLGSIENTEAMLLYMKRKIIIC
jgi:hypothetical protein